MLSRCVESLRGGVLALALVAPATLLAQPGGHERASRGPMTLMGHALVQWMHVDPTPGQRARNELRITQLAAMLERRLGGGLVGRITLDGEGLTIRHGELAPGNWGEGFVDRRHPHTYVHELLVSTTGMVAGLEFGIIAGKGFVTFGSDDPMSRSPLRYPTNHHLAQVLERALVAGQLALGPVTVEASLFNGDEPEHPGQWPNLRRFADSWSMRLHLEAVRGLELTGSFARVRSPEHRDGFGGVDRKVHGAIRFESRESLHRPYALAELARTSELEGSFILPSFLVEAGASPWGRRHDIWVRYERTTRPEEERESDFRLVRPQFENAILGRTRWTTQSIGYGFRLSRQSTETALSAVGELVVGSVHEVGSGLFDAEAIYGRRSSWSVAVGLRLHWRMLGHRMGRYGLLARRHSMTGGPDHRPLS